MLSFLVRIVGTTALLFSSAFVQCALACEPVTLAWDQQQEPDIVAYLVVYQSKDGQSAGALTIAAPGTTAVVSNLTCGLHYFFSVRAVSLDGIVGVPSDVVDTTAGVPNSSDPTSPSPSPPQPQPQPPPPPEPTLPDPGPNQPPNQPTTDPLPNPPTPDPSPNQPTPDPSPNPPTPEPEPIQPPALDPVWAFQTTAHLITDDTLLAGAPTCIFLTNASPVTTDALLVYLREDGQEVGRSQHAVPAESRIAVDCGHLTTLLNGASTVSVSSMQPLTVAHLPVPLLRQP